MFLVSVADAVSMFYVSEFNFVEGYAVYVSKNDNQQIMIIKFQLPKKNNWKLYTC